MIEIGGVFGLKVEDLERNNLVKFQNVSDITQKWIYNAMQWQSLT